LLNEWMNEYNRDFFRSSEEITKMLLSDLVFVIFSLSQTGIGLLGNSILLIVYVRAFISQPCRKKPTDLILAHLTMANMMTLLTQGVPGMILVFGAKHVQNEMGCKMVLYLRRVSRGLSICSTSLMSVFQAIIMSPSNSCLAQLKPKAIRCILPSFIFFWALHIFMYINILVATAPKQNVTKVVSGHNIKYCSNVLWINILNDTSFVSAVTFRDVFFVFLMSWASAYMVIVLYRHQKQVRHIHSTSLSPRSSPEARATHTILLLVTCFIVFYFVNCSINLSVHLGAWDVFRVNDTNTFLGACYPSFCPLVLISKDPRVSKPQWILEKVRELYLPSDLVDGKFQAKRSRAFEQPLPGPSQSLSFEDR
uniref:Vomeronasal type-1 receptor n=1 Tax=Ornithorhynchus anatinus TaxID=9258 RepID=F6YNM9_ORNAN